MEDSVDVGSHLFKFLCSNSFGQKHKQPPIQTASFCTEKLDYSVGSTKTVGKNNDHVSVKFLEGFFLIILFFTANCLLRKTQKKAFSMKLTFYWILVYIQPNLESHVTSSNFWKHHSL